MSTTIQAPEARELTPEEHEAQAKKCFEIEENIKEAIAVGRSAYVALARAVYEFDQEQGWLALGYENQTEWLAQPDIGMTRTDFFRFVRRHRELAVYRDVPTDELSKLEPSKLDIVLPAIQDNRVKLKEALSDVSSLGARDLREKYGPKRDVSQGPPEPGDDNTIDSTARPIETDAEPTLASDVSPGHANGSDPVSGPEDGSGDPQDLDLLHAGAVVDSWIAVGGDKRKAQRNWKKFMALHPAFAAVDTFEAFFGGAEGVTKEDVKGAWERLCAALGLNFSDA